jgi:DNA-3-methyladenine glycosylase
MILDKSYFSVPATYLAPDLLGKIICCRAIGDSDSAGATVIRARITETECYYGEEDTACHAHKGRTPRTDALYLPGGAAYIYLCYGMYDLFNIVTGPADHPEAVLIRGVEGAAGPGRTTKYLNITRAYNRLSLTPENGLWIEDDGVRPEYESLPRVGIGYASPEDQARLWRFRIKQQTQQQS